MGPLLSLLARGGLGLLRGAGVAKQVHRGVPYAADAMKTVPGVQWGNLLGTGMLGMMAAGLMSGEDTPEASEDDLEMVMLLQQLQGAGFQSGPQETMMDPRQSMIMRQDPTLQANQMNRSIENMSSYGELDFLDELMQENAQLIAQISQRTQAMSQMADPVAAGIRPF